MQNEAKFFFSYGRRSKDSKKFRKVGKKEFLFIFFTPYKVLWIQQHIDIAQVGTNQKSSKH
jgi:hypothetical protein